MCVCVCVLLFPCFFGAEWVCSGPSPLPPLTHTYTHKRTHIMSVRVYVRLSLHPTSQALLASCLRSLSLETCCSEPTRAPRSLKCPLKHTRPSPPPPPNIYTRTCSPEHAPDVLELMEAVADAADVYVSSLREELSRMLLLVTQHWMRCDLFDKAPPSPSPFPAKHAYSTPPTARISVLCTTSWSPLPVIQRPRIDGWVRFFAASLPFVFVLVSFFPPFPEAHKHEYKRIIHLCDYSRCSPKAETTRAVLSRLVDGLGSSAPGAFSYLTRIQGSPKYVAYVCGCACARPGGSPRSALPWCAVRFFWLLLFPSCVFTYSLCIPLIATCLQGAAIGHHRGLVPGHQLGKHHPAGRRYFGVCACACARVRAYAFACACVRACVVVVVHFAVRE